MSEIIEEILCENRKTMALRLLKLGKLSNDEIAYVVDLPLEAVERHYRATHSHVDDCTLLAFLFHFWVEYVT